MSGVCFHVGKYKGDSQAEKYQLGSTDTYFKSQTKTYPFGEVGIKNPGLFVSPGLS